MVSRKASAAKLPSVGLRLNASKPESRLVKQFWDGRFILFRVKLSILYTVFVITCWWVWLFGAIEFKRHDNLDKTSQIYPGIVCVERGHCASIHWGLSNGLTIWLGYSTWAVLSLWEWAAHFALDVAKERHVCAAVELRLCQFRRGVSETLLKFSTQTILQHKLFSTPLSINWSALWSLQLMDNGL